VRCGGASPGDLVRLAWLMELQAARNPHIERF